MWTTLTPSSGRDRRRFTRDHPALGIQHRRRFVGDHATVAGAPGLTQPPVAASRPRRALPFHDRNLETDPRQEILGIHHPRARQAPPQVVPDADAEHLGIGTLEDQRTSILGTETGCAAAGSVPSVGTAPTSIRANVDFPEPLCPTMVRNSAGSSRSAHMADGPVIAAGIAEGHVVHPNRDGRRGSTILHVEEQRSWTTEAVERMQRAVGGKPSEVADRPHEGEQRNGNDQPPEPCLPVDHDVPDVSDPTEAHIAKGLAGPAPGVSSLINGQTSRRL